MKDEEQSCLDPAAQAAVTRQVAGVLEWIREEHDCNESQGNAVDDNPRSKELFGI